MDDVHSLASLRQERRREQWWNAPCRGGPAQSGVHGDEARRESISDRKRLDAGRFTLLKR
jgi:hypothetical protein